MATSMLRAYYMLAKPGIVYGNLISVAAGCVLASSVYGFDLVVVVVTLVAIGLVMASGCVFNNYLDRGIDKHMARTQGRALVVGNISVVAALVYGTLLAATGLGLLALYTNLLTAGLGVLALVWYVIVYGIAKRTSVFGTLVGSVAGALPPAAGYTAVSGVFDEGAAIIFLILTFWQMPHFYAIAMYRLKDYKAASIPVLPAKYGMRATKVQIIWFIAAYMFAAALLWVYGYAGYIYLVVVLALGAVWFWRGLQGFRQTDDVAWAKKMFGFSLWVLLGTSVMIAAGVFLP